MKRKSFTKAKLRGTVSLEKEIRQFEKKKRAKFVPIGDEKPPSSSISATFLFPFFSFFCLK